MTRARDPGSTIYCLCSTANLETLPERGRFGRVPIDGATVVTNIVDPTITDRIPARKRDPGNTDHQIRLALITLRSNPQARSMSTSPIGALRSQVNGGGTCWLDPSTRASE